MVKKTNKSVKKRKYVKRNKKNNSKIFIFTGIFLILIITTTFLYRFFYVSPNSYKENYFHNQEEPDADARINSLGEIDFDWSGFEPVGTSPKGDNKFSYTGLDLKEFYLVEEDDYVYLKLVSYDTLNNESSYDFYLFYSDQTFQLRVVPFSMVYLWEQINGSVKPFGNTKKLRIEIDMDYIEVKFYKDLFSSQDNLSVSIDLMSYREYHKSNNITSSRDSDQFDDKFNIIY